MKKALGRDHPSVATTLNNLAGLYFAQSDWRTGGRALARSDRRSYPPCGTRWEYRARGDWKEKRAKWLKFDWFFRNLVKSIYRDQRQAGQAEETFLSAQWAIGSKAAGALAQMSARQSAGSSALAKTVRERQDSVRLWQASEKRMNALRGAGKSDKKLQKQMAALDRAYRGNRQATGQKLSPIMQRWPRPKPLTIKQVQKLLGPDEALVLLLDTPKFFNSSKEIKPRRNLHLGRDPRKGHLEAYETWRRGIGRQGDKTALRAGWLQLG